MLQARTAASSIGTSPRKSACTRLKKRSFPHRPHSPIDVTTNRSQLPPAREQQDDEFVTSKDHNSTIKKHYRNQIFTMEYNPDGSRFATAGKDYKVCGLPVS